MINKRFNDNTSYFIKYASYIYLLSSAIMQNYNLNDKVVLGLSMSASLNILSEYMNYNNQIYDKINSQKYVLKLNNNKNKSSYLNYESVGN